MKNTNRYLFFDRNIRGDLPVVLHGMDAYIRKFRPRMGYSLIDAADSAHILIVTKNKEEFLQENNALLPKDSIYKILQMEEIKNAVKGTHYGR